MAGEERHQPLRGLRGALVSRGRASLRTRRERLLAYGPPVLQVALAVGVAWELAHLLVGSSQPVFAAITAAVSLGVTVGQRGRLAVEMVLGIAVGIGGAGVAVVVLGTGVVQLVVLAAVTMLLAVLMGGGPNLIVQSGVWAILVATFQGPGEIFPHRFLDAMVGGAVAIVFSQLVFPLDPVRTAGRAARLVLHELADRPPPPRGPPAGTAWLPRLRDGDEAAAARIRHEVAALELRVSELREALAMSTGAVRLAPPRLRQRPRVERYGAAAPHIALAVQDAGSL